MKIAIIAPGELPIPATRDGAIEILTTLLIEQNEIEKKHELTVFSYYEEDADRKSSNYKCTKVVYLPSGTTFEKIYNYVSRVIRVMHRRNKPAQTDFVRKCIARINKENYDCVLVEGNIWQVVQVKENVNIPVIMHVHTDMLHVGSTHDKVIYDSSDFIWGISDYIKKQICSISITNNEKVKVLKNCIDTDVFCGNNYCKFRKEFRRSHRIADNEKVIVYCGRVDDTKGVKEIIQACKTLSCDYKLLIIGKSWFFAETDTEYEKELKQLSDEIKERVIFVGYIPHKDLAKYYAVADFGVFPSKCNEAAGLVLLEAMSTGIPVISSVNGGIPEYADKRACDLVVTDKNMVQNLAKAMRLYISDNEYYEKKKAVARDAAIQYNKQSYYKNFCKLLEEVKETTK